MKTRILIILLVVLQLINLKAQTTNDILNLLVANKTISQQQADSVRAEATIKQHEADAKQKLFPVNASKAFQIGGFTQVRYQNLDMKNEIDGFDIRRARIDLKGVLTPYWSYRLQTEFAKNPKLLDAYSECKISDYLKLTLGQFTIPFSLENLISTPKYELINLSQVVEALSARSNDVIGDQGGRDIGIQASGNIISIGNRPIIEYKIGVFNGNGVNAQDKNEAKDIIGRLVAHLLPGLDIAGSYLNGWDNFGTPAINQERSRFGFDLNYVYRIFSFSTEYIKGTEGYGVKTLREGWYAQTGIFIIPQKLQFLLKYDTYDPNTSFTNDISTYYISGINYNFNNWSRIQASYSLRKEQGAEINNNVGSIQYQVNF